MARVYGIKKRLTECSLDEKSIKEIMGNGDLVDMSYCFCCAGYFRRYLQIALDLKLKTKEIVSSPINSAAKRTVLAQYFGKDKTPRDVED